MIVHSNTNTKPNSLAYIIKCIELITLNNFNSLSRKKSKVRKQHQIKTELSSIENKQLIKPNLIIVLLYIRQKNMVTTVSGTDYLFQDV